MKHERSRTTEEGHRPSPVVALLLSFVAPGLGLMYVGQLLAGLVINLLFVLIALLFVISVVLLKFFPLYPALVLMMTWVAFCALSGWRAKEIVDEEPPERRRGYQHPLIYALVALVTFAAPLTMTAHFTARHLMAVVPVEDAAMYPQAQPGDRVLVDRTGYHNVMPRRGDPVVIRHPYTGQLALFRIVAVPSDIIEMHGYTLTINDRAIGYAPLSMDTNLPSPLPNSPPAELWIEDNHDRQYLISIVSGVAVENGPFEIRLDENQYFVLADNRSLPEDAGQDSHHVDGRVFGAIGREQIEGRPTHVAWSTTPNSGTPRWDRIGLPTH